MERQKSVLECAVCLDEFGENDPVDGRTALALRCGHVLHDACVDEWTTGQLQRSPDEAASCPVCRTPIHGPQDVPAVSPRTQDLIENLMANGSPRPASTSDGGGAGGGGGGGAGGGRGRARGRNMNESLLAGEGSSSAGAGEDERGLIARFPFGALAALALVLFYLYWAAELAPAQ